MKCKHLKILMVSKFVFSIGFAVIFSSTQAQSSMECTVDGFVADYLAAYNAGKRLENMACYRDIITTMDQALSLQRMGADLREKTAKRIGYKAGVIDKPTQKALGIDSPIFGTFFEGMFLSNASVIDTSSSPTLLYEGDFAARVSNEAINQASTIEDVAANIDQVMAFIEVPSRMYPAGTKSTGFILTAMNSIARFGVMGDAIPTSTDPGFLRDLGQMQVTITDGEGKIVQQGNTKDVPHPLLGVLFVKDELKARGERLKVGDLISLGSFTAPTPAQPGQDLTVSYEKVAGRTLTVSVSFK